MIKTQKLLGVAALLWAIAGANITFIGIRCTRELNYWWIYIAAVPTFALFRYLVFGPVAKKYAARIADMTAERTAIYRVFSLQGYLVMIFMVGLGVTLRVAHLVPVWFIAFFYLGLGLALFLAAGDYLNVIRAA